MGVIFRKIGGRVIPIGTSKKVLSGADGGKSIHLRLTSEKKLVGHFSATQSMKREHRFDVSSWLERGFRGKGLGKEFYGKLKDEVVKQGGRTMAGVTQNDNAIRGVRKHLGKTREFVSNRDYAERTFVTLVKKFRRR